jgi:uncharacterized membrane protein HdeD (DUF308 family)
MTTDKPASAIEALSQSRGWLIASGILSIFVGFLAMGSPILFSGVIAIVIGIFAIVSGLISLGLALTEKHQTHRILNGLFAIIRVAAGAVILYCVPTGMAALTLVLAVFLIVEGISSIGFAFKMRSHNGWVWMLLNGVAALVLGAMVWSRWPNDSAWVIGLFYGINSLFFGMSLLMLGFGAPKAAEPAKA